jgi:type II secretory pathway component PulF
MAPQKPKAAAIVLAALPLVLLAVAIVVQSMFITPSAKKVFSDFGLDVPVITKVVISFSDSCVAYQGWPATLVLSAAAAGIALAASLPEHRRLFCRLMLWPGLLLLILFVAVHLLGLGLPFLTLFSNTG